MGKKSKLNKGGKMYDDDPGCKYMVIENPWPRCEASRRTDRWFQHVGAWLWYASDKTVLPEEIYYVKTVCVFSRQSMRSSEWKTAECAAIDFMNAASPRKTS